MRLSLPPPLFWESFPIFYCFIFLVKYIVSHSKSISITSLLKKQWDQEVTSVTKVSVGGSGGENNAFLHFFISMKSLQQEAKLLLKTNLKLWTSCLCHISHTQSNLSLSYNLYTNDVSAIFFITDISLCTHDSFLLTVTALKQGNAAIQMHPGVGKKMVDKGSWQRIIHMSVGYLRRQKGRERQINGKSKKNRQE